MKTYFKFKFQNLLKMHRNANHVEHVIPRLHDTTGLYNRFDNRFDNRLHRVNGVYRYLFEILVYAPQIQYVC